MPKIGTSITGACGEHYVASLLSGFGLIVALPRAGVKGSDLFVADAESGRPIRVQVKTGRDARGEDKKGRFHSWDTSYKVVDSPDESLWFAYVHLNGWPEDLEKCPEVFFVPSSVVITHMTTEQKADASRTFFWLYDDVAKPWRGKEGLDRMRSALKSH